MRTRTDEPLDTFEDRLLGELREVVAQRSADDGAPAPPPGHPAHRRRWVLAGAAAAATAGLLTWNLVGQTPPAYAIAEGDDGSITVTIERLEDAEGLQAALAEHGIAADVTYLPDGQTCAEGRFTSTGSDTPLQLGLGPSQMSVTVPADAVGEGQTLVLVNTHVPGGIGGFADIAEGPVGECVAVPLPQPGPGDPAQTGDASGGE